MDVTVLDDEVEITVDVVLFTDVVDGMEVVDVTCIAVLGMADVIAAVPALVVAE